MKYKAVSLVIAILLTATPVSVYAQQKSYIVVETPQTTEPTTIITGQPFVQTYVVRFIDLTDSGEKISIQEESLKSHKTLGDFKVLDFYIDKQTKQREFLEHIWYLRYTLQIINPKKGAYVIPPFEVPWKHKKAGQEENDPTILVNSDFKTEEVHVTYATLIPEKSSYLEIRDEINLGNFEKQAWFWWIASWFLRIVPVALWLIALVVSRRSVHKESKTKKIDEVISTIGAGESIKNLSRMRAWLELRMSIRRLESCRIPSPGQASDYLQTKAEVVTAIKNYLRTHIPQLSVGSTPLNMAEYISVNMNQYSTKKDAFLKLAQKAVACQTDVEKGRTDCCKCPSVEAGELRRILSRLRLQHRVILFVLHGFLKIKNRLAKTGLARKLWVVREKR